MIYDCFCLFNELDILELRLIELSPVVDRFVLVEATTTHSGVPKPLYYDENKARFAHWHDKIIHIITDLLPGDGAVNIWLREIAQRNAILLGLQDAEPTDPVMISDVDEIPRRSHVPQAIGEGTIYIYDQTLHYYNLNTVCTSQRWRGTRITTAAVVKALTPDGVRYEGGSRGGFPALGLIQDGGWHLSYFGNAEHIKHKIEHFLHQEFNRPEHTDPKVIAARVQANQDVYGRDGVAFEKRPAYDMPMALWENPWRWGHLFAEGMAPEYHENWYEPAFFGLLQWLIMHIPQNGICVEIGCWEGRSAAIIANAVSPRVLHCVDHWGGNDDEDPNGASVQAARERDVYATFRCNMQKLTRGNFLACHMKWQEWIAEKPEPISFLHLDASHDEASVRDCLNALKPFLLPGAIVCGDDYYSPGVRAGVAAAIGGPPWSEGRFWIWEVPGS